METGERSAGHGRQRKQPELCSGGPGDGGVQPARWQGDDEWTRSGPGGAWRGGPGCGYDSPRFESREGERGSFGSDFGRARRRNYSGMGPKDYRRKDERILEDVSESLADHADIDAGGIEVTVGNGLVTLAGRVADRRVERMAEDLAASVRGVIDVQNLLKVPAPGQP